ncbi:MAG: hypothetical protein AAFX40_15915, partial [Cyanobacteria bacterium J06639_1]
GLLGGAIALFVALPGLAHQVEIDRAVGGTLHVEPNDTPRAGETTTAWFALVKKGGEPIPLSACDCRLAIYALPRAAEAEPMATPELQPIDVGRDRGIPSAEVTFPAIGLYELAIEGTPKDKSSFEPFALRFEIAVAAGD